RRGAALLGLAAVRAAPQRLPPRADAAGTRGRGRGEPSPAARSADAPGARARRRDAAAAKVGRRQQVTPMDVALSPDTSRAHETARWRPTLRKRVWVAAAFIALWAVAIESRL